METENFSRDVDSRDYGHIAKWTVLLTPFYVLASKLYYQDAYSMFLVAASLSALLGFSWGNSDFFKKNGKSFFPYILTSVLSVVCCVILGGVLFSQIASSRCGPMSDCGFYVGYGDPFMLGGEMLFVSVFVLGLVLGGGWVVMKLLRSMSGKNSSPDIEVAPSLLPPEKTDTQQIPLKQFAVTISILLVAVPAVTIPVAYTSRIKEAKEHMIGTTTAPPTFMVPSGTTNQVNIPPDYIPPSVAQIIPGKTQIASSSASEKEKRCPVDAKMFAVENLSNAVAPTDKFFNMKLVKTHYNLKYAMCLAEFTRKDIVLGSGKNLVMNVDLGTEVTIIVPPEGDLLRKEIIDKYMSE